MKTEKICEILKENIPEIEIFLDESMKKHTSFRIGGNAQVFVKAKNVEQVKKILEICNKNDIPLTIIGNGSNLLVRDEGIEGVVLKICLDYINIEKCSTLKEDDDVEVIVGSGVLLSKLAQILLKQNIKGFEFASGIPGTIGGAIRMNAGAYGLEFKDIVIETTALSKSNYEIVKLSNDDQQFQYRNSFFQNKKYIILESKLLLKYTEDTTSIKEKMNEYKQSRIERQPIEFPNAGSTFKRGEDFITAKLIDECGLKGYRIGDAQVSTKHAGFIVNLNNATAKDVLELIDFVKKSVYEKFGKNIELEIEIV